MRKLQDIRLGMVRKSSTLLPEAAFSDHYIRPKVHDTTYIYTEYVLTTVADRRTSSGEACT